MYCLHCGDCCLRMSPLAAEGCPALRQEGTFYFCDRYKQRPQQCKDHDFPSRFCPIGMDKLGLTTAQAVAMRIDEGYFMLFPEQRKLPLNL